MYVLSISRGSHEINLGCMGIYFLRVCVLQITYSFHNIPLINSIGNTTTFKNILFNYLFYQEHKTKFKLKYFPHLFYTNVAQMNDSELINGSFKLVLGIL